MNQNANRLNAVASLAISTLLLVAMMFCACLAKPATAHADEADYQLYPSLFLGEKRVFWDTSSGKAPNHGVALQRIDTVVLGGTAVSLADSSIPVSLLQPMGKQIPGAWKTPNGTSLSSHYPKAEGSNPLTAYLPSSYVEETRTLSITPKPGYYVTKVTIACTAQTSGQGAYHGSPYDCGTWNCNNAFTHDFTVAAGGTQSIDVPSEAFGHLSNQGYKTTTPDSAYFILIETAPLPSPLYVEYDYGDIVSNGADRTTFGDPDAWLNAASSSNNYGTGGILTNYTQFKHAHNVDPKNDPGGAGAAASQWAHYAGAISPGGEAAAAAAGYAFAGWKAQYYSECEESPQGSNGNNRTLAFKTEFAEGSFGAGDLVPLTTHVRLIAQWEKAEITTTTATISKTVTGNMGDPNHEFSFTASVENGSLQGKQWTKTDASGNKTSGTISGAKHVFTLKHGETMAIGGIVSGTSLTVSEETPAGYKAYIAVNGGSESLSSSVSTTNLVSANGLTVAFRNDYEVTIDTGVGLNDGFAMPMVLVASAAGLILLARKRRME